MDKERLEVLLYNAIICIEENGYDIDELKTSIGISKEEYDKIMEVRE